MARLGRRILFIYTPHMHIYENRSEDQSLNQDKEFLKEIFKQAVGLILALLFVVSSNALQRILFLSPFSLWFQKKF